MKLLACLKCSDIFSLKLNKLKTCQCGETSGQYIDNLNAEISGHCMPIGFSNPSIQDAIRRQIFENKHTTHKDDTCCKGQEFIAFTIPDWAKSIKRIDKT